MFKLFASELNEFVSLVFKDNSLEITLEAACIDVEFGVVVVGRPKYCFTESKNEKPAALVPAAVKTSRKAPITVNSAIRLTTKRGDKLFFDIINGSLGNDFLTVAKI